MMGISLLRQSKLNASSLKFLSEEVKILALFPVGRGLAVVLGAVFFEPALIASQFIALELEEIVDKNVAQLRSKHRLLLQRIERRAKTLWQVRTIRRIGFVVRRARVKHVVNTIETGDELRHD